MEIKVYENIMKVNDRIAYDIRKLLDKHNIFAVNLISSPGSGKTTIIEKIIPMLQAKGIKSAVIEGDLATSNDAERVGKLNVPAVQINTGSGCHLDANMILEPISNLPLDNIDFLIIENVGNLVCPVGYYLGENLKIGIMSTTEGDDKPEKYPLIINAATAMVLNKIDLVPYTNFSVEKFETLCHNLNPKIKIFKTSAVKGTGLDEFVNWMMELRLKN